MEDIGFFNKAIDFYDTFKMVVDETRFLKKERLLEAIQLDFRCSVLIPEWMEIEGLPKLTEQEKKDIVLVGNRNQDEFAYPKLPVERRTEAVSFAAVEAYIYNIRNVPEEIRTEKLMEIFIRRNPEILGHIKYDQITPKMLQAALDQTPMALCFFSEDDITHDIALKTVKRDGNALFYVPEEMRTPDVCRAALNNVLLERKGNGNFISYESADVVSDVTHSNVCREFLKMFEKSKDEYRNIFANINEYLITEKMAWEAIRINPKCLGEIPHQVKTPEFCMEALKKDWENLRYVPKELKTVELCNLAVNINPHALQYVPDHLKKIDMCLQAFLNDPYTLNFVPERMQTTDNIFSFYKSVCDRGIKFIDPKLTLEQVKSLYRGDDLEIREMLYGEKTIKAAQVSYERDIKKLNITTIKKEEKTIISQQNNKPSKQKGFKI